MTYQNPYGPAPDPVQAQLAGAVQYLASTASSRGMTTALGHIAGIETVVARPRPQGRTTKLHIFMYLAALPPGYATHAIADDFLAGAVEHSIHNKGGLTRGMQTGTASIAVLITDRMAPDAAKWAAKCHKSRFAALAFPASVELADRRVIRPQRMVVGAVYARILRNCVDENVTRVLFP